MGRLTGRFPWARGPRFILSEGRLERAGDLPADPAPGPVELGWLGWRRLIGERAVGTRADVDLTVAVFREALGHLQDLPGRPRLHVLYLESNDDLRTRDLLTRLAALGIVVHRVEALLPDFARRRIEYVLGGADHHPNAHANRLIADYIARQIVNGR